MNKKVDYKQQVKKTQADDSKAVNVALRKAIQNV